MNCKSAGVNSSCYIRLDSQSFLFSFHHVKFDEQPVLWISRLCSYSISEQGRC